MKVEPNIPLSFFINPAVFPGYACHRPCMTTLSRRDVKHHLHRKTLLALVAAIFISFTGAAQLLRKPIPDKLVVLTFDDAPITHYSYGAPLLKKFGFNATFHVSKKPDFTRLLKN
jgi:hypothetical protein